MPSKNDIKALVATTKELHSQKREAELSLVKSEIEPFKNETLGFLKGFEKKLNSTEFKNLKSKEVLVSYSERLLKLVDDTFGGVYNA